MLAQFPTVLFSRAQLESSKRNRLAASCHLVRLCSRFRQAHHIRMRFILIAGLMALALAGCTTKKENPDELRRKTAETTAELKREAQAVAQGVREGWSRDKLVNLNSASKSQLMDLPGITSERADKIIAGRPYQRADELVTRGILPKSEYDKISAQVVAGK